ncbi:hypothetical protein [Albibacillus kandeliae]|uniref:hypothetical protein n=1 Tax=Albibacillus kandeliae TaxID=2174228 RepID=UPI000D687C9E|nr:hypothetical protein [Albibacillus kandeliae]
MRLICRDPLNASCRVLDMARRLDLELSEFTLTRTGDGLGLLVLELLDPAPAKARLFAERLGTLLHQLPEHQNV